MVCQVRGRVGGHQQEPTDEIIENGETSESGMRMARTSILLSTPVCRNLGALALKLDTNKSDLIRTAIEELLVRHNLQIRDERYKLVVIPRSRSGRAVRPRGRPTGVQQSMGQPGPSCSEETG